MLHNILKEIFIVIFGKSTTTEILHENIMQALVPLTPVSSFTDWRLNTDHQVKTNTWILVYFFKEINYNQITMHRPL